MTARYALTTSRGAQRIMAGSGDNSPQAAGLTAPDPLYFTPGRAEESLYEQSATNPFAMGIAELLRARRLGSEDAYGNILSQQNDIAGELANRRMALQAAQAAVPLMLHNAMPGGLQSFTGMLPEGMLNANPDSMGMVEGALRSQLSASNMAQLGTGVHNLVGAGMSPEAAGRAISTGDLSNPEMGTPQGEVVAGLNANSRAAVAAGRNDYSTAMGPVNPDGSISPLIGTIRTPNRAPTNAPATPGAAPPAAPPATTASAQVRTVTTAVFQQAVQQARAQGGTVTDNHDGTFTITAHVNGANRSVIVRPQ